MFSAFNPDSYSPYPFPDQSSFSNYPAQDPSLQHHTAPSGPSHSHSYADYPPHWEGHPPSPVNDPLIPPIPTYSDLPQTRAHPQSHHNQEPSISHHLVPSPVSVPPLPLHIETAFSPHPAWATLPPPHGGPSADSALNAGHGIGGGCGGGGASESGGGADGPPSQPLEDSGAYAGRGWGITLPPPPPILSHRSSIDKGKAADRGAWAEDFGREMKRTRTEPNVVERDVALLQTYLTELVHLMSPFAATSSNPSPSRPPPYLHTRFSRLSSLIHSTLESLVPNIHQTLSPSFTPASGMVKELTAAEKEMAMIRKRRDALIAKAATKSNFDGPAAGGRGSLHGLNALDESAFSAMGQTVAPGRCHGCGVAATPEWRRGPDGPASLCNSCGLHYAKLAKKREADAAAAAASSGRAEG